MPSKYTAESTASELVDDYANKVKGKVFLITGVSPGGIGAVFAEKVAKAEPGLLILAGRNSSKVQQTADSITSSHKTVKVRVLNLDLSSLAKARTAAEEVNGWSDVPNIDVLVNNAGMMATEYGKTVDGYETQFATNHLAPFLFTNMIMEKLLASSAPRVLNVSSDGHRLSWVRFDDHGYKDGKTYNKWNAYGQSKTANMLFALSLAEKLGSKKLLAFSLHPGVIMTNLGNHLDFSVDFADLQTIDRSMGNPEGWKEGFDFKNPDQGAATTTYAALSPELSDHNGAYLIDCRLADPFKDTVKSWATSSIEAEKLWQLSEKLVGQPFSY